MIMYKGKYLTNEPKAPESAPLPEQTEQLPEETPAVPVRKPKKKSKKGTILFYSIYGGCVMVVILVLMYLMLPLNDWLVKYEASQPEQQSAEVFRILFEDPDWGVIYQMAGVEDTLYEGQDEYVAYMEQKVGDQKLSYMETAAGLSGDHKYIVKLGEEKVASFTLTGGTNSETQIVDWKLGTVEVFFSREESVLVEKLPEYTVYVNGVPLDSSFTVRTTETVVEDYLTDDAHGYRREQQYVDGLLMPPQILVMDAGGSLVTMEKDPQTGIYQPQLPTPDEMTDEERQIALDAAEANALFAIRAISTGTLRKYFDPNSQIYSDICNSDAVVQSYASYAFDETVTAVHDFYRYNNELFSARVTMQLNITRYNGTVKTYEMNTTYFFTLNSAGNYMVTNITNVDTAALREQVRLHFMDGDTLVSSQLVAVDAQTLILPDVTAPEGETLLGWARQEIDDSGNITMTIVLKTNDSGIAIVPAETVLEPMTLYAVYGAADEVAQ